MIQRIVYGISFLLLVIAVGKNAWREESVSPHVLVDAPYAHAQKLDGNGTTVAVIDEGFDCTHLALKENFSDHKYHTDHGVSDVFEPLFFGKNGYEQESHGTHVAGIVAGLAPQAEIIPIQLGGFGGDQAFVKALHTAELSSAHVVNISMRLTYTGRKIGPNVQQALIDLAKAGKLIVIAAGNESSPLMSCAYTKSLVDLSHDPRLEGRLLLAGASAWKDGKEVLAPFSNYPGKRALSAQTTFITAPGADIVSTITGGRFGKKSGTSMAAPMVVGAACLLRQAYPHLSAEALAHLLLTSARQVSLSGEVLSHAHFGAGIVNLRSALERGKML